MSVESPPTPLSTWKARVIELACIHMEVIMIDPVSSSAAAPPPKPEAAEAKKKEEVESSDQQQAQQAAADNAEAQASKREALAVA